ncbi:UAA transporter protein [Dioscorea alata]|uniref:UAA transporter protein n=1 Tax=Dioscorea alata TaxID=55571 RepID=A0ACB7UYX3_DIOAL|nr:UAA transporter protein [Dioscorea alata]
MSTLKIMRIPYGEKKELFRYSLFLVFCNHLATSAVSDGALLASRKTIDPVAPVYKYCTILVSNILTTTCQYEALKYVSFPVQTLAKCAKMIPVMITPPNLNNLFITSCYVICWLIFLCLASRCSIYLIDQTNFGLELFRMLCVSNWHCWNLYN